MKLTEVLRGGRQCDEDGVEIIMSRQACCEAADEIENLYCQLAEAQALLQVKDEALQSAQYAIKGREHTGFIDKALAQTSGTDALDKLLEAERERCAKVCDDLCNVITEPDAEWTSLGAVEECADRIRELK